MVFLVFLVVAKIKKMTSRGLLMVNMIKEQNAASLHSNSSLDDLKDDIASGLIDTDYKENIHPGSNDVIVLQRAATVREIYEFPQDDIDHTSCDQILKIRTSNNMFYGIPSNNMSTSEEESKNKSCDSDLDCNCSHISDSTDDAQDSILFSHLKDNFNSSEEITTGESSVSKDSFEIPVQHTIETTSFAVSTPNSEQNTSSSCSATDDDKDSDFNVNEYSEDSDYPSDSADSVTNEMEIGKDKKELSRIGVATKRREQSIHLNNRETTYVPDTFKVKMNSSKKHVRCMFCSEDVLSKNFVRHIENNHRKENEVKKCLIHPKGSKQRRNALSLLRNSTNFDLYLKGILRPYRQTEIDDSTTFYPCVYCKGLFKKEYLKRHSKVCLNQRPAATNNLSYKHYLSDSQTLVACALDPTNVISKLNVKEQVFDMMKGDDISFEAKKDILIAHFGESYLKKHKRERKEYACSSRMRQLSRLLIEYRNIVSDKNVSFKDMLLPKNFDFLLAAARQITGYDPIKKNFTSPSLAMHLGTHLKLACDELIHLILKESPGFECKSKEQSQSWQQDVKNLKKLIESRWNIEVSSLANKDLQEKRWNKPMLIPLVSDIKIFRDATLNTAIECEQQFAHGMDDISSYKLLVQCTLALLIIFNRRRIGDVQFLKIRDYMNENKTNFKDFEAVLTDAEKVLTKTYKRVINSGKGSRAVVILVPKILQKFISTLLKHREKYISTENEYVFAMPQSKIKWGQGDVAIRFLTKRVKLQHPEAISSNKLRKQIATVAQVMNLSKEDTKQFSKFMGHTEKTHSEFYELPADVYQTAKVSKLLLLMEKGKPIDYKGKCLDDIQLDDLDYPEENDECDEPEIFEASKTVTLAPDIVDYADESCESEPQKTSTKTKKSWSDKEINLLKKHFSEKIIHNMYPSSEMIRTFIKATGTKRTAPQIKSKLQHLMKKRK